MINLLSDGRKDAIRAARTNVILVRYTTIIVMALFFITGALYVSYSLLQITMKSNEDTILSNDVKADVYSETRQEIDALSTKLDDAKTILNQEVRYSQVLVKIGQLMPTGTVISDLTINDANFNGTAFDLIAYAKTATEAGALQSQFQSSPLFSQVSIKSTEESGGVNDYPVKISITVMLNRAGIQ